VTTLGGQAPAPVIGWHAKAAASIAGLVGQIRDEQWSLPTPCTDWTVRELVAHLVSEARWTPLLLAGLTIEEVGDSLDGDLLGDDPAAACANAIEVALEAARGPAIAERCVHLSFGVTPAQEYLRQLTADYLIHGWDLATALGLNHRLDPELVSAVGGWFLGQHQNYLAAGAVAEPIPVGPDGDPQVRLLALFGRDARSSAVAAAVGRFGEAFDRGDVDAVMAAMTADCAFESTAPPDGVRYEGQAAVRAAWTQFFESSADARFETEEQIVCGDRVIVRWRYTWGQGPADHVRGVDVFRVRDGLVAEKASYVKG